MRRALCAVRLACSLAQCPALPAPVERWDVRPRRTRSSRASGDGLTPVGELHRLPRSMAALCGRAMQCTDLAWHPCEGRSFLHGLGIVAARQHSRIPPDETSVKTPASAARPEPAPSEGVRSRGRRPHLWRACRLGYPCKSARSVVEEQTGWGFEVEGSAAGAACCGAITPVCLCALWIRGYRATVDSCPGNSSAKP